MERNFRKKIGRFIKKGDHLLDVVALKDFSFDSICEHTPQQYDNPAGNLIYARYHEKESLEQTINSHPSMSEELREVEARLPILQPIDFTGDWRRQQERASKRRKGRSDEDDDFDLEFESNLIQQQLRQDDGGASKATSSRSTQKQDISSLIKANEPPAQSNSNATHVAQLSDLEVTEQQKSKQAMEAQASNLDTVSKAINDVAPKFSAEAPQALHIKKDPPDHNQALHAPPGAVIQPQQQGTFELFSPETEAMKEYKEVLDNPELSPSNLRQAIEQAKADGYQHGYQQGEEKATMQLHNVTKNVVENVEGILNELETLRRGILEGAEKNFAEVCQALAEALLGHELAINPAAFSQLISNVVREHIGEEQFKIVVHPDFHNQLKKMNLKQFENKIVEDSDLKVGDFRIESQQAVIDGNLKQMISDLLNRADMRLFIDATDKAS